MVVEPAVYAGGHLAESLSFRVFIAVDVPRDEGGRLVWTGSRQVTMPRLIQVKRGLDLPLAGAPVERIGASAAVQTIALLGADYVGMKPTMAVAEGDHVALGQLLFTDKLNAAARYTAPGAGTVVAVDRGAKRAFQAVVIELDGADEVSFGPGGGAVSLSREAVRDQLVAAGLWVALRTRPYSRVPQADTTPHSLFITAIDTNPLALSPEVVIAEHAADFRVGVKALSKLTDGKTYVCTKPGADLPVPSVDSVEVVQFAGPHPAGLPGTHIHFLDPVGPKKTVWHIGYQDVIAVGRLLLTGRLFVDRVVALGGPAISSPRLLRTRLGANLEDLTKGELKSDEEARVISGSVLAGRGSPARGSTAPGAYLGRYHDQIAVLFEGRKREFFGWMNPGLNKFSVKGGVLSTFFRRQPFALSTSLEGSPRAMVPIGAYEKVMPLDVIPTFLLRSLIVGDTDQAQQLGCLELDEEDLGLCTFVCPGKYDYGPLLRDSLTTIERDG